jgi:hypothetical protein
MGKIGQYGFESFALFARRPPVLKSSFVKEPIDASGNGRYVSCAGIDLKARDDDDKVAVQVKSYGYVLGDKSDRLKGRAAEPFKGTFPDVRCSPSRYTSTSNPIS